MLDHDLQGAQAIATWFFIGLAVETMWVCGAPQQLLTERAPKASADTETDHTHRVKCVCGVGLVGQIDHMMTRDDDGKGKTKKEKKQ